MLLMATMFGKNVPKYGGLRKSCSIKYAENFDRKCWWNRVASFVPFTFSLRLCRLRKLVGEINSCFERKTAPKANYGALKYGQNVWELINASADYLVYVYD